MPDVERNEDLLELHERIVAHDLECAAWTQLAQQVTVAREEDAILRGRELDEQVIARMRREEGVEVEHAQPACEALEHRVGEKAGSLHEGPHVTDRAAPR